VVNPETEWREVMVQEHNQPAAHVWSQGGRDYDFISFNISDALAHAAQRLWPQPGENILDVGTGTGWTARNAAFLGANVTAVDIADDLLAAANSLAAHIKPAIKFRAADAEALPFDDHSFDGVISTFGVMFAGNPDPVFRVDFINFFEEYRTKGELRFARKYLLTKGIRR